MSSIHQVTALLTAARALGERERVATLFRCEAKCGWCFEGPSWVRWERRVCPGCQDYRWFLPDTGGSGRKEQERCVMNR